MYMYIHMYTYNIKTTNKLLNETIKKQSTKRNTPPAVAVRRQDGTHATWLLLSCLLSLLLLIAIVSIIDLLLLVLCYCYY